MAPLAILLLALLLLSDCGVLGRRPPVTWHDLPEARYPIPPYAKWLKGLKICLDPGHGGQAYLPGYKRGPTGVREAEVNLRVAHHLRDFLEDSGAIVVMTREGDTYISLRERCEVANQADCDLFISMHHNASSREDANYTSTWYHFTPDYSPASMDLARHLQAGVSNALRLPEYPPTGLYSDQLMYRSGFGVLRNIKMPGALMEASFHSNPEEEKKLTEGEYNKREAYGYFLGLAQYAAGGFPRAELLEPPTGGDTPQKTPLLRLQLHDGLAERGIWGKERLQIFTETVILRVDGEKVSHELDKDTGVLTHQIVEPLSNDWHTVQVSLINAYKNHDLGKTLRFRVAPPPAFASIDALADTILADGISYVPLEIQAWDADSLALTDGSRVAVSTDNGTLERSDVELTGGKGYAYLHSDVYVGDAVVTASAGPTPASAVVHFGHSECAILEGRITDAMTQQLLGHARAAIEDETQTAEDGRFFFCRLRPGPMPVILSAEGYFDFTSTADLRRDQTVILDTSLYPLDDGVLFEQTYILDPQFGGSEFGERISDDLDAADLNLAVCQRLRDYLTAAGARVIMLREKDVYVSPKERVLRTNEAEKGWYLRVEHCRAEGKPKVEAYAATADEYAKQHSRSLLEPLATSLGLENGGLVNAGDYEIVQANKNALSVAFMTIGQGAVGMDEADPVLLQREAYSLYRGIVAHHSSADRALRESLSMTVTDARTGAPVKGALAVLDGVMGLSSDLEGRIAFSGLLSRVYVLRVTADGYQPAEIVAEAGTAQTSNVQLEPNN